MFILREEMKMGDENMVVEFPKNSLHAVSASIEPFKKFIAGFGNKTVTIWMNSFPNLYSIDKLVFFKFVKSPDMLVLFGSNDNVKISIPIESGFGITVKGEHEHYWLDSFNENEALVIKYDASI